jgi:hypothetical protein
MNLLRWLAGVLPALLLCTALADGYRPAQPVFPALTLDTSLLKVGAPSMILIPSRTVGDQSSFFPAYLSARLPASPVLPVSKLAQTRYSRPSGVVVQMYSVAALLAVPESQRGLEIRREIESLRAINAGTLDPRTLIPAAGQAALQPFQALPYLFRPFEFQWAAGAVKKLTLPGGLRGVRYLVIRAGDTGYVPAEKAEYTFQGLSANGQFYVMLTAPYMPAGVLSEAQVNQMYTRQQQGSSEMATYDAYALNVERQMDANTRAPRVLLLDKLVKSIRLH